MKKLSFFLLGFFLSLSLQALAQTTPFSDVQYDAYYADALNYMTSAGVIKGYDDNTFRPDRGINRAEAVTILKRYDDFARDRAHLTIDNVAFIITTIPSTNVGEINYNVEINFITSKPAKTIIAGGSRQISDDELKEEHSAQLSFQIPKDTLPRTFQFEIKVTDDKGLTALESRQYTFSQ